MADAYTDVEAKARAQADCDKRNKHVVKTHHMRWRPLWDHKRGWHCALRPKKEPQENLNEHQR